MTDDCGNLPLVLTEAGREWVVDATGAPPDALRDLKRLQDVVALVISEMRLSPIGAPQWHVFPGEAGVTGMVMLSESHITVHTFPELGLATFNLYCCRPRTPWLWQQRLQQLLGATHVHVREIERGQFAFVDRESVAPTTDAPTTDAPTTDAPTTERGDR